MLLIIDGNNLAHRCKHVFSLSTKGGVDISIIYGFLKVLVASIRKFKSSSVIVCWDSGIPKYRTEALPEYKANREKRDEFEHLELLRQMRELDSVLPLCGIVCVRKAGTEADDLMYHTGKMSSNECIIITTDGDLLQAVTDNVGVFNPPKNIMYTPELVMEEFGCKPKYIAEWKSFSGDGSDNIKGVPGIGPKTTKQLFLEFGSARNIFQAATETWLASRGFKRLPDVPYKEQMRVNVAKKISKHNWHNLTRDIYVMDLSHDLTGSRLAVLDAVEDFQRADKSELKRYFMDYAFVSLMDDVGVFSKLKKPVLDVQYLKMPVFCARRTSA